MWFIFSVFAFILMVIIGQWLSRWFFLLKKSPCKIVKLQNFWNVTCQSHIFHCFILLIPLNNQENFQFFSVSLSFMSWFLSHSQLQLDVQHLTGKLRNVSVPVGNASSNAFTSIFPPSSDVSSFHYTPWEHISKHLCLYAF